MVARSQCQMIYPDEFAWNFWPKKSTKIATILLPYLRHSVIFSNTHLYLPITQALCVCCTYAFFLAHVCAVQCECEDSNYCLDPRWWPPAPHLTTARRPTPSPSHRWTTQTQLNRPPPMSATRTARLQARLSHRLSLRAPQPLCLVLSAYSFYPSPCSLSLSSSTLLSISWK